MKHRITSIVLICLFVILINTAQAKPFTTRKGIAFGMDYDAVCAVEAKQKLSPKEGSKSTAVFDENIQYAKVPAKLTYDFSEEGLSQLAYEASGEDNEFKAFLNQATKELGKPVQLQPNEKPAFLTPLYTQTEADIMVAYAHWHTTYDEYDVIADLWQTKNNQVVLTMSYADQALTHPVLKNGAKGAGVKIIQQFLINYLYMGGEPTGIYDAKTVKALKDFQYNNELKETGICDEAVWELFEGRPVEQATVYKSKKGKVYHSYSTCSGMKTATAMTLTQALKKGLRPCQHCH